MADTEIINAEDLGELSEIPDDTNVLGVSSGSGVNIPWSLIKSLFALVDQIGYKADQSTLTQVQDTINELNYRLSNLPKLYEWLVGAGTPSNTIGADGQFFINTDGDLYQKVSGSWVYQLTLGNNRFLGSFSSISALTSAHPSPVLGSYAYIDPGVGSDAALATWDETDLIWVEGGSAGGGETAVSIKTKYESNPDTNAFNDAYKAIIDGLATVATSADYADLINKPALAAIATSGAASDLTGLLAAIDSVVGNAFWRNDHKNNTGGTTAPIATDDDSQGYTVGSKWIDVTNDNAYLCVDA